MALAVETSTSCRRPFSTTFAPSFTRASATALPIPVPPPVTIATFLQACKGPSKPDGPPLTYMYGSLGYLGFQGVDVDGVGERFLGFFRETSQTRMFRAAQAALDAAAGAQQADTHGRFRPAMLAGNLLHFVAFNIVAFEHDTIIGFALVQNALDVYGSHVHAWRGLQFG